MHALEPYLTSNAVPRSSRMQSINLLTKVDRHCFGAKTMMLLPSRRGKIIVAAQYILTDASNASPSRLVEIGLWRPSLGTYETIQV